MVLAAKKQAMAATRLKGETSLVKPGQRNTRSRRNNPVRRCDLATGAARIRHALENVEIVWSEASSQWNDAVSRRFREHHLDPMVPRLKLALDAIARMSLLMNEVERDCES